MEELIRARLLAASGVTSLAGSRIDFGGNPQGTAYPRICLWTISDFEGLTISGPDGFSQGRVQADCYGLTYSSAKSLSRAVRAALDGYSGGGLQLVTLIGTRDTREGGANEAERPFRVSLDFATFYNPAS
jgi:hypothetical protein